MATYIDIHGNNIPIVSADPSNPLVGEVWYNTTTSKLKGYGYSPAGTWATVPSTSNTYQSGGAAGISTSALAFGSSQPAAYRKTEYYDGTSWTAKPDVSQDADYASGFGLYSGAIAAGDGGPVGANSTSSWSGTAWTSVNPMTQYGYAGVALGIQTAGLLASRFDGSGPGPTNYVELWDGTCWSNSPNDLNTSRYNAAAAGTQGQAIVFGGVLGPPGPTGATETYSGGAWTTVNPLNTARNAAAGSGTQTQCIAYGGGPPTKISATELWDGTCWSANPNGMNTARGEMNNTLGTYSGTLCIGGVDHNTTVEEYTGPGNRTLTFTAS